MNKSCYRKKTAHIVKQIGIAQNKKHNYAKDKLISKMSFLLKILL